MNRNANLQEDVLNALRRDAVPCTVHLTNGVPLRGTIRGFDNFVVLMEGEGRQMMVYKHAISSVTPQRAVHIGAPQGSANE